MRIYALYIVVAVLAVYAWKDWFKCLCALILMMAVTEHEDMPKSMFGIQGFNMWNLLFLSVFLAWLACRRRQGLKWDMPRHVNVLLLLYLGVILVGFLRAVFDRSHLPQDMTPLSMISEELINTLKWVLPGLLLYDGCRDLKRLRWAMVSILGMYFLLVAQVIKRIPWSSALGGEIGNIQRIRLKLCHSIGFSACDMSTFLAGASWAMLAAIPVVRRRKYRLLLFGAAGVTAFGQALTGGRAGYAAWGATGLVLCLIKWRKYLILAPVVPVLLFAVFPGAAERALTGFGQTDVSGQAVTDDYLVTSGRTLIWPHVVEKIGESPLLGHGRLAMWRTGLTAFLARKYGAGERFSHPHNMYLETLLDNGIAGSIPIFLFFGLVALHSAKLFRSADPVCSAVGGFALSMVCAQLFSGVGSQHFYPRESAVGMWAAIFLMLRVHRLRERARATAIDGVSDVRLRQVRLAGVRTAS